MSFMNRFSRKYVVTAADIDTDYRITIHSVLCYFQDCFALYLAKHHLAAFDLADRDIMWVISDFNVELSGDKPLWSEHIEVEVWISEVTTLRLYVDFRLRNNHGRIFASGNSCWNTVVHSTKRITACDAFASQLSVCDELALGAHRRQDFPQPTELVSQVTHKINISDLDFNGHVGNRSYLAIAAQTAPQQYVASHTLRFVGVKFMRESFLHDEIVCELHRCGNETDKYIHIIKRSDGNIACRIYSEWGANTDQRKISECLERNDTATV